MSTIRTKIRRHLQNFAFTDLFHELGWDNPQQRTPQSPDGFDVTLMPVMQKRGFVIYHATSVSGDIPDAGTRSKIETWLSKRDREHIVIFTDGAQTEQVWLWVRRELGQPIRRRPERYRRGQSGERLAQKLEGLHIALEEEEDTTLYDVSSRVRTSFNVERATKKFYDRFKKERNAFEKFVQGITDAGDEDWYVSVMLNRLMFVYFIQKKGFLDGDPDYLRNRLRRVQTEQGGDQFHSFYRYFLLRLFHEGLGLPADQRDFDPTLERLIGNIPYLNGGIFQLHEIERRYDDIQIGDAAFERILDFFDQYDWHLDDRPLHDDSEINPDVLGYIFEKYINQKQMGAYYTKEDITEYISQNTILPYLLDQVAAKVPIAFDGADSFAWSLLRDDPDRYIYPAVKFGMEHDVPPNIAAGIDDVAARGDWNTPTPPEVGLPTEIWRETVARRQRCAKLRDQLANGEVTQINDLITHNLDIKQFAQDVIERCEGADMLAAVWRVLGEMTILDPTCGSGAFLFAALNILQPLYEACVLRMREFLEGDGFRATHPRYSKRFDGVQAQIAQHPNETYYVLKTIMVNNLYGVDIMAEAVEICKLRLFLKLAAQVEKNERAANFGIEPLPDIDFNVRAGNTLVGFATYEEAKRAVKRKMDFDNVWEQIEDGAEDVKRLAERFREQQTTLGGRVTAEDKQALRDRLGKLETTLNRYLAQEYGVNPDNATAYAKWRDSHQPFHWFTEFYGIVHERGGFSAIIGNPPWKEYSAVKKKEYSVLDYATEKRANLYGLSIERSFQVLMQSGRLSFIVQLPLVCSGRMANLRSLMMEQTSSLHVATFDDRPGKLFDGLQNCRSTIFIAQHGSSAHPDLYTTNYNRWPTENRERLFSELGFVPSERIHPFPSVIPKFGNLTETSVFQKAKSVSSIQIELLQANQQTEHYVFYQEAARYWMKAVIGLPYYAKNSVVGAPAHGRYLYFHNETEAAVMAALLNSNLFYLYFIAFGDCFHLSQTLAVRFPVPSAMFSDESLAHLGIRLIDELRENATRKTISTRGGDEIEYAEYYVNQSKSIIDAIDQQLARHYGFTDEELDYIINYDIKYRMGDELFADVD